MLEATRGVDVIALPELFAARGSAADNRAAAAPLDGSIAQWVRELATAKQAWVLAGSVIEGDEGHVYNTSFLVNREGQQVATYRKIHLFEATLEDGTHLRESDIYEAGHEPTVTDVEGWRAGLAICYDLRFPELFRHYADSGMKLLFAPSDFPHRTGKDHWNILVRARAIENQCFVVAPNQCGINPGTGVSSYGHSMIVGPWGDVLAEAGEEETVLVGELNPADLRRIRQRVPALKHRRIGG